MYDGCDINSYTVLVHIELLTKSNLYRGNCARTIVRDLAKRIKLRSLFCILCKKEDYFKALQKQRMWANKEGHKCLAGCLN